jgi:putative SOS response-associated peptidase YedK
MCGRFAASSSAEDLVEFFEIDEVAGPLPAPAYNIAPTDPIAAVLERFDDGEQRRVLTGLRWGLVPSWSPDARGAARLINARVETVAVKPSFRKALASRRCVIPADGYFEWYGLTEGGSKPVKQPYFIRPLTGEPLAMAGLYEFWKAPDSSWLITATIITTQAADAVGRLHDRMPMVVHANNWDAWLDRDFGGEPTALLSVPAPELESYPVSTAVNRVGNSGPELLRPIVTPTE